MDNVSDVSDGGNTKKPRHRSRVWFFTFNNPRENEFSDLSRLSQIFGVMGAKSWIYQLEEGILRTKHLQGVVQFTNQVEFNSMKQIHSKIHWERAKDFSSSINYCCKPEGRLEGPWYHGIDIVIPKPIKLIQELRPFQQKIVDMINDEKVKEDDRKIYWFWDGEGNKGKTQLAKYICSKYNALYLSGKGSDIKYAVAEHIKSKKELDVALFYFTRSYEDCVSYDSLESIKDGIFFSGKFESKQCIYNSPIVICFANFEPDLAKLSLDRWVIEEVTI